MVTKYNRTMVTLSKETKEFLEHVAKEKKQSISATASELLEFALDLQEDMYFSKLADERTKQPYETLSHKEVWE